MKYLTLLFLSFFTMSCGELIRNDSSTSLPSISCYSILDGFLNNDQEQISAEINAFCNELPNNTSQEDRLGHRDNTLLLVEALNQCPSINAELLCYACLKSKPAKSQITITIGTTGRERGILLYVPENTVMEVSSIF
ncbi:MAG: hypothetical protein MI974_33345 [Chitinophagales bacterium]|nr:hypothetical protein [Chitinophagales bacterium]